jgi:hypothetical protein
MSTDRLVMVSSMALLIAACGEPTSMDAGMDAGLFRFDASIPPPPPRDSGLPEVDAGPPPPRTVFGQMTVNGVQHELSSGYGTANLTSTQLRLGTADGVPVRYQVTLVLPPNPGANFMGTCGMTAGVFFSAQQIQDAGTAFFTLNPTCTATLSAVPAMVGEDWVGTFAGTADWEPRSALDAGFGQLVITNGSFTVHRQF